MADRLAGGNEGVALLANTLATAGALVALILTFGPISGAHFNPTVTLAFAARKALPWGAVPGYLLAQLAGAVLGVWLAHVMFGLPVVQASAHVRAGFGKWAGEFTATFALLSVIWSCTRHHPHTTPYAVACIITAAYWFTSSTSFANPVVTVARALSDTFAGIRPIDAPAFVVAQIAGAAAATALFAWLTDDAPAVRRPLSGQDEPQPAAAVPAARTSCPACWRRAVEAKAREGPEVAPVIAPPAAPPAGASARPAGCSAPSASGGSPAPAARRAPAPSPSAPSPASPPARGRGSPPRPAVPRARRRAPRPPPAAGRRSE